jgi:nucleotide-binding universal stress UspA family protein
MKTILTPIDGSETSLRAVVQAGEAARRFDAAVHLLHVVPPLGAPAGIAEWARSEHVSSPPQWLYEQAVADSILEAARDRLRDAGVARIEVHVDRGNAAKAILDHAGRLEADLIIMGTRGLSDLGGLVLGSTAHKVIHGASCGVWVVK